MQQRLTACFTIDIALTDTASSVLYGMFAIMSIVAGSINNVLGPKYTMFLGTTGYGLYVGSLWCFQVQGTRWFVSEYRFPYWV